MEKPKWGEELIRITFCWLFCICIPTGFPWFKFIFWNWLILKIFWLKPLFGFWIIIRFGFIFIPKLLLKLLLFWIRPLLFLICGEFFKLLLILKFWGLLLNWANWAKLLLKTGLLLGIKLLLLNCCIPILLNCWTCRIFWIAFCLKLFWLKLLLIMKLLLLKALLLFHILLLWTIFCADNPLWWCILLLLLILLFALLNWLLIFILLFGRGDHSLLILLPLILLFWLWKLKLFCCFIFWFIILLFILFIFLLLSMILLFSILLLNFWLFWLFFCLSKSGCIIFLVVSLLLLYIYWLLLFWKLFSFKTTLVFNELTPFSFFCWFWFKLFLLLFKNEL